MNPADFFRRFADLIESRSVIPADAINPIIHDAKRFALNVLGATREEMRVLLGDPAGSESR